MKLLLTNQSTALSTEKRHNRIHLKWDTNIGIFKHNFG